MSAKGTAESSLVKQPYTKHQYTSDTFNDFEQCCDRTDGPLFFMENYMMLQHPIRGAIKFKPYPYQVELIKSYACNRYSINLLGRQMGKCLTEKINIVIRNKRGEVYDIPIGIFHEYEAAKRDGTKKPDISPYKRSE